MSMERISRALELAARQREARLTEVPAGRRLGSVPHPTAVPRDVQDEAEVTATFSAPIMQTDAARLEREHILPPNGGGRNGTAYKLLRTQVLRRLDQMSANTLAVLSPAAAAGKTLTAINLAIAIAAEKRRTALLVDLDLRSPSIHKKLGLQPALGIEDCLQDDRPVQEAIIRVAGYERFALLPARSAVEHSSELLTTERASQLIAELRSRYTDRIILFDLPPVLQADDALAFSRNAQAGLMVVGEGGTKREDLKRSLDLLGGLTMVGTVLNGSREPVPASY